MRVDRDPFIRADTDNRSASIVQVESLGKGGIAAVISSLVLCIFVSCFGMFFAVLAIDRIEQTEKRMVDKVQQTERRAMDQSNLAKQEARIALDIAQTAKAQLEAKEK